MYFSIRVEGHYKNMSTDYKKQFDTLIKGAKNIVITAHRSPDPDAISSVLSIYFI